jgi:uncharacterized lipoprotein
MFKLCGGLLLGCALLVSSGCSTLFGKHNFVTQRETEYLRSQATPPLQVPTELDRSNVGDDYVVPAAMSAPPTQAPGLLPPGSLAEKIKNGAVSPAVLKEKIPSPAVANTVSNTDAVSDAAGPVLTLDQSTAALWNRIGDSLKLAGYVIANQNQKTGIYYVLDTPSTFGKIKMDTPIYRLHVQDVNGIAQAYVTDDQGKPLAANIAQRILDDLKNALAGNKPSTVKRFFGNLF